MSFTTNLINIKQLSVLPLLASSNFDLLATSLGTPASCAL